MGQAVAAIRVERTIAPTTLAELSVLRRMLETLFFPRLLKKVQMQGGGP